MQTFWRGGMIAARVSSITLATTVLGPWILLIMGKLIFLKLLLHFYYIDEASFSSPIMY